MSPAARAASVEAGVPDPIIRFENVDIVFGGAPKTALPLIDEGLSRAEIAERTGQTVGVAGASLEIAEAETLVLMGLSGSGKSTLLRAINGLAPVARGRALVADGKGQMIDPAACRARDLRRLRQDRVSMVFQQFGLLPWRTVAENVGFGLELAGKGRARRRERAMRQLETVGLAERADARVSELSGGMQQRVGLARALATEAPILLMDEPFSALDPIVRSKLQDDLIALQSDLRRTIVFVSHDLDEAFKIGDRIAIMEGGRIVQVGTPARIASEPATSYVADFVSHMNPVGFLTARDIMREPDRSDASMKQAMSGSATSDTPVAQVMAMLKARPGVVAVIDHGTIVGTIGAEDVVVALSR